MAQNNSPENENSSVIIQDLYERLIAINQEAFGNGLYDAAYHALASALHCAKELEANELLHNISRLAKEQIAWIDQNLPEYHHSSQSARDRNASFKNTPSTNIFAHLSMQAETILTTRKTKHRKD